MFGGTGPPMGPGIVVLSPCCSAKGSRAHPREIPPRHHCREQLCSRSHCQRLLFSLSSLPLVAISTVELVFSFFNSWRMPDRTWVCRQEPKVQFIGFLRPEHRAKSPALGFVA